MADRKAKESATGEKGRRHLSSFEHEPVRNDNITVLLLVGIGFDWLVYLRPV